MKRSREFCEGLREELSTWLADGILTPGAARALASRYDLDSPDGGPATPRDRTAVVAGVAAAGLALALALAIVHAPANLHLHDGWLLPLASLGAALAAAPLAIRGEALASAAAALRGTGRWLFYLVAFALSFVPVAEALRLPSVATPGFLAAVPTFLLALAAVLAGLRRSDVDAHARGEAMLLTMTVLAFTAGLFLETGKGAAVVANLALAFLAAGRIVRGLSWGSRGAFWEGLAVAAVLAGTRIIEVALPGWPRFTGAFLVGAGAIAAGLFFERRRARAPEGARAQVS